jgi:aerobic-type carbon monoxide dehydrogenase small subunit (CoxS/CutS family)
MPTYTFNLNGKAVRVDAPPDMPLLWVLRDKLGITGPKYGCGVGVCRACTSHINGQATQICTVNVSDVAGKTVVTIEGLATARCTPYRSLAGRGRAVRILPTRPDHAGRRHAQTNKAPTDADIDGS